jgi:hypothetical protein
MRHWFATWALDAGLSIFELSRYLGSSVEMIDRVYGHLAKGAEGSARTSSTPTRSVWARNGPRRTRLRAGETENPRASRGFMEAGDGARTHDPQLGKRKTTGLAIPERFYLLRANAVLMRPGGDF